MPVSITVTDQQGGSATAGTDVQVSNVKPTLTLNAVQAIFENGEAILTGTITDPGTLDEFTFDVDWGDPESPNNVERYTFESSSSGVQTFSLFHQYTDDRGAPGTSSDNYTISVTLTDDDGGATTQSTIVTVNNEAPTIDVIANTGPVSRGEFAEVTVVASDPSDPLTYEFDFDNDGTYEIGPQSANTASHAYAQDGVYVVGVRVSDDDGGIATGTTTITVESPAPPLEISAVVINDGDVQRAQVRKIEITFNQDVNVQALIDDGTITQAVRIVGGTGTAVNLSADRYSYDPTTFRLSIDLAVSGTTAGVLGDGDYELQLDATLLRSAADLTSQLLDTDGVSDGTYRLEFRQLKNDFDGDGLFGIGDRDQFFTRLGTSAGDSLYDPVFDLDNDGTIDNTDYTAWRNSLRTPRTRTRSR